MRSATGTCVLMLGAAAAGCSLLVASPDDYTYDLTDGAAPARDAGPDAAPLPDAAADGAVPPDASPDGGPDAGCVGAEQACGGACVDVQTDLSHCGRCDRACPERWSCRDSDCHDDVVSVSTAPSHTCAALASGAVFCWGKNETGQLGTGDFEDSLVPRRVVGIDDVTSVSVAGNTFGGWTGTSCATRRSGEVWCWGRNDRGQVGDGTLAPQNRPVRVTGVTAAVSVHTAFGYACARLSANPRIRCWGAFRNVAEPPTVDLEATQVSGVPLQPVSQLTTSDGHACFTTSGQVYCWGRNQMGQLGDEGPSRDIAFPVSELVGVVQISSTSFGTCARLDGGEVRCWGRSDLLGVGRVEMVSEHEPQLVIGEAAGLFGGPASLTTYAVGGASQVLYWGLDQPHFAAAMELRTVARPNAYVEIEGLSDISVGLSHACSLHAGRVACWGSNAAGQLGDGTMEPRTAPTLVVPFP
ncbi:MAG: hypothetical protein KF729_18960 [Sandaracinaceae bacterium]|nr:hypothetical protein [Sandaracinaceae bacterium]